MMELLSLDISVHLCPYDYIMTLSILVMRMVCTWCWGRSTRTAPPTSAASGPGTSSWRSATGWSPSWTSRRWGIETQFPVFTVIDDYYFIGCSSPLPSWGKYCQARDHETQWIKPRHHLICARSEPRQEHHWGLLKFSSTAIFSYPLFIDILYSWRVRSILSYSSKTNIDSKYINS